MLKRNQEGGLSVVANIVLGVLFVGVAIFAGMVYKDKNHYKNDSDKIAVSAAAKAAAQQKTLDAKQFAEQSKKPYKTFTGHQANGSISFQYPKTWSAYVDQTNNDKPINGYFYPDIVPGLNSDTALALRVELLSQDYGQVLQQFTSYIKQGTVRATPYKPAKLATVNGAQTGTMLKGAITQNVQGSMLVIRVRDKTLEISTQSNSFQKDFDNILASLTYNP